MWPIYLCFERIKEGTREKTVVHDTNIKFVWLSNPLTQANLGFWGQVCSWLPPVLPVGGRFWQGRNWASPEHTPLVVCLKSGFLKNRFSLFVENKANSLWIPVSPWRLLFILLMFSDTSAFATLSDMGPRKPHWLSVAHKQAASLALISSVFFSLTSYILLRTLGLQSPAPPNTLLGFLLRHVSILTPTEHTQGLPHSTHWVVLSPAVLMEMCDLALWVGSQGHRDSAILCAAS